MVSKTLIFGAARVGLLGAPDNCAREDAADFFFRKTSNSFETVSMVGVSHLNPIPMISVETFGHWFLSSKTI